MSALSSLAQEIKARGSMAVSAAERWLTHAYAVTKSEATRLFKRGEADKLYRVDAGVAYPVAHENPCGCKKMKFDAVAALPSAPKKTSSRNPVGGKAKSRAKVAKPVAKKSKDAQPSGPSAKPAVSAAKGVTKMAKKSRGKGKSKVAKKSGTRKPKSTTRKRTATRKAVAPVNVFVSAPKAASKPRAKSEAKAKKPRAKTRAKAKKPRAKTKTARKAAKAKTTRKASKPRVSKKAQVTRTSTVRQHGKSRVRTETIRKVYRMNPISGAKQTAVAIVGVFSGYAVAELLDRFITTMPQESNNQQRSVGTTALMLRHAVPNWKRLSAVAGSTALFGGVAYFTHRKHPKVSLFTGSLAVGMGLKLAALGLGYLLPKALPVASPSEDSWMNQLFPENSSAWDTSKNTALQSGSIQGTRRMFGPVAGTGAVGCGCGCGVDTFESRPTCGCRLGKGRTSQPSSSGGAATAPPMEMQQAPGSTPREMQQSDTREPIPSDGGMSAQPAMIQDTNIRRFGLRQAQVQRRPVTSLAEVLRVANANANSRPVR